MIVLFLTSFAVGLAQILIGTNLDFISFLSFLSLRYHRALILYNMFKPLFGLGNRSGTDEKLLRSTTGSRLQAKSTIAHECHVVMALLHSLPKERDDANENKLKLCMLQALL